MKGKPTQERIAMHMQGWLVFIPLTECTYDSLICTVCTNYSATALVQQVKMYSLQANCRVCRQRIAIACTWTTGTAEIAQTKANK